MIHMLLQNTNSLMLLFSHNSLKLNLENTKIKPLIKQLLSLQKNTAKTNDVFISIYYVINKFYNQAKSKH